MFSKKYSSSFYFNSILKHIVFPLSVSLGTSYKKCFRKLLTAVVISQGKAFALPMKKTLFKRNI